MIIHKQHTKAYCIRAFIHKKNPQQSKFSERVYDIHFNAAGDYDGLFGNDKHDSFFFPSGINSDKITYTVGCHDEHDFWDENCTKISAARTFSEGDDISEWVADIKLKFQSIMTKTLDKYIQEQKLELNSISNAIQQLNNIKTTWLNKGNSTNEKN